MDILHESLWQPALQQLKDQRAAARLPRRLHGAQSIWVGPSSILSVRPTGLETTTRALDPTTQLTY